MSSRFLLSGNVGGAKDREDGVAYLRAALGRDDADFRPGQWEAVDALVRRRARLLVVQRTGWGKSLVYFLATRLRRLGGAGPTLLISPLLSLMRNQILAARNLGLRAETINSTNEEDWPAIEQRLVSGEFDLLLISPERLANEDFVDRCLLPISAHVGLFVVDEAHCISDWGHDFRPDYRRIARVLRNLPPNMPVLATTATANDRVVDDVAGQLGSDLEILRGPLTRASLRLQNIYLPSQAERLAWLAWQIKKLPGSGIVYTLTKLDAERVARWLRSRGVTAEAYHAGSEDRGALEDRLLANEVKALVATVALGMGFDKPDLGFVIHFQRPVSVVHYYQQVGRAGRAVDNAYGVLMNGKEDDLIADYFVRNAFPSMEEVATVIDTLRAAPGPMHLSLLLQRINLSKARLENVLKFLSLESPAPLLKTRWGWAATPAQWRMPVARIERISDLRRYEQQRMRQYMNSQDCLMQFLAEELNDPAARACGKCVNCLGRLLPTDVPPLLVRAAQEFLKRWQIWVVTRKQWPVGMSLDHAAREIPESHRAEVGRALSFWGDGERGALVRDGKRAGRLAEQLVEAAADFIEHRWRPDPFPAWIARVPSQRHPTLVLDFAKRLAHRLGIPFVDCVAQVRATTPQKSRENSYHQARNVAGAFAVNPKLCRREPMLLIDDAVDSRWTFTVIAAALREAGSGPVFPFALADTSVQDGD